MKVTVLGWIEGVYETTTQAMNRLASALAPAPSAIALYMSLASSFGVVASMILAFVVEGLGFATVEMLMRALSRSTRRPVQVGAAIFAAVYLGTVFALLALIPEGEEWATVARAFPLLTIVGAGVVAGNKIMDDDASSSFVAETQKIELRKIRRLADVEVQAASRAVAPTVAPTVAGETPTSGVDASQTAKLATLETLVRQDPRVGLRPLGEAISVSKDTAGRMLRDAGWVKGKSGWSK